MPQKRNRVGALPTGQVAREGDVYEYERTGTRKYPDSKGQLWLAEGEYGKGPDGVWYARPFGDHMGSLKRHEVTEHSDGTITVSPSILITGGHPDERTRWHGYLQKGIWRKLKE